MKDKEYKTLLQLVKLQIAEAQDYPVIAATREMFYLYWKLGQLILSYQAKKAWGAKFLGILSRDFKNELPKLNGFRERNQEYRRKFALEYPEAIQKMKTATEHLLQIESVLSRAPWSYHKVLKDKEPRAIYSFARQNIFGS